MLFITICNSNKRIEKERGLEVGFFSSVFNIQSLLLKRKKPNKNIEKAHINVFPCLIIRFSCMTFSFTFTDTSNFQRFRLSSGYRIK